MELFSVKGGKVHLLKTRGDNQCGRSGPANADINGVTCDDCYDQHEAIIEAGEEVLNG